MTRAATVLAVLLVGCGGEEAPTGTGGTAGMQFQGTGGSGGSSIDAGIDAACLAGFGACVPAIDAAVDAQQSIDADTRACPSSCPNPFMYCDSTTSFECHYCGGWGSPPAHACCPASSGNPPCGTGYCYHDPLSGPTCLATTDCGLSGHACCADNFSAHGACTGSLGCVQCPNGGHCELYGNMTGYWCQ